MYEKVLEAIFNQEMVNKNSNFYNQIGIDVNKVTWFANYLVYSFDRCEMDYIVMQSDDNQVADRVFVIEFSINKIDFDHIEKAFRYSKWVKENIFAGSHIVKPILICAEDYKTEAKRKEVEEYIKDKTKESNMRLSAYIYKASKKGLDFKKLDY